MLGADKSELLGLGSWSLGRALWQGCLEEHRQRSNGVCRGRDEPNSGGSELQKEVTFGAFTIPFEWFFDSQLFTALSFKLDFLEASKMRETGAAIGAAKELPPTNTCVKPFPTAATRTQCRSPCSRCLSMQNCPEGSNADLHDQNFCKIFGSLKSVPCLGWPSRLGDKSCFL